MAVCTVAEPVTQTAEKLIITCICCSLLGHEVGNLLDWTKKIIVLLSPPVKNALHYPKPFNY